MISNYFKAAVTGPHPEKKDRFVTVSKTFGFDDRSPGQIRQAFDDATAEAARLDGKVSVFKTPKILGPWSDVPFVGVGIGEFSMEPN